MDNSNFGQQYYGFNPYGVPQGTGYQFNGVQPQQVPKQDNWLTQEEMQKLVQKENQFSLQITELDKLRAGCNHRRQDGLGDALIEDENTGICRCSICGYEFRPIDTKTSTEDLQESVQNIVDILQTIKLLYINLPGDAGREYYQIIPLLEKIPKLFEFAVKDYTQHENFNSYGYNSRNMNGMNLFNAIVGMMNGMPQQQAPFGYGQPQQQAPFGYQQQPMGQPMGQPAMNPGTNGFGYMGAAPQQAYQPQMTNYQLNPQQVPTGATAPVSATATTDGATVDVNANFKA